MGENFYEFSRAQTKLFISAGIFSFLRTHEICIFRDGYGALRNSFTDFWLIRQVDFKNFPVRIQSEFNFLKIFCKDVFLHSFHFIQKQCYLAFDQISMFNLISGSTDQIGCFPIFKIIQKMLFRLSVSIQKVEKLFIKFTML